MTCVVVVTAGYSLRFCHASATEWGYEWSRQLVSMAQVQAGRWIVRGCSRLSLSLTDADAAFFWAGFFGDGQFGGVDFW